MPQIVSRVIDVYPYRLAEQGDVEFLLLRRASTVQYARQWRMVGGKMEPDETAWQAALRELREETGCPPLRFWSLPSVNIFYEWQHDRINLAPAFAAQLGANPVLCDEHDAFVWLSAEEATARLGWSEQQRLLRLAARLLREGIPPECIIKV